MAETKTLELRANEAELILLYLRENLKDLSEYIRRFSDKAEEGDKEAGPIAARLKKEFDDVMALQTKIGTVFDM